MRRWGRISDGCHILWTNNVNEKEAKKILSKYDLEFSIKARVIKLDELIDGSTAKGYLEAVEKAKGLAEVIREFDVNHSKMCWCGCRVMRQALAKWEKDK